MPPIKPPFAENTTPGGMGVAERCVFPVRDPQRTDARKRGQDK